MTKGRIISIVILIGILVFLMFVRGQQLSEAKAKAIETAKEKAQSLGYQVNKMEVLSKKLEDKIIVVLFKSNPKSEISDLAVCLRYNNVYDIKIWGEYKNINYEKDKEKIASDITQKMLKEISQGISGK
ncbi:MAG: hypothetical protein PHR23_06705 [bacterium]|nr:hypothetical protein [bacterium]